jgi:hypothetical protein
MQLLLPQKEDRKKNVMLIVIPAEAGIQEKESKINEQLTRLLKDADAHADCKAELIFYDSHGNPSVTYKMTGRMVKRWVERGKSKKFLLFIIKKLNFLRILNKHCVSNKLDCKCMCNTY